MSNRYESGSPNRREEGSNAGCLALRNGEEVTARYISLEAKECGLEIGECTIIDTDKSRIQKTGISGHRVNVFEYEDKKYFTTNLNRLHSEVVTASELYEICNESMGLERIGTKDYRWFADP